MSGAGSVTVVIEVTREGAILGAGPDYWGPAWRAVVSDPVDVDGPPLAVVWSDVGPDDAVAKALAGVTFAGVLGGVEGRGAGA